MILLLFQLIGARTARVSAWWQGVRLPCKIAPATGLPTLGGMGYVRLMVAERIKENVVQRSAVIDIVAGERRFDGGSLPLTANSSSVESLRNRIEVVGGLSLVAEVDFSDMELAGA